MNNWGFDYKIEYIDPKYESVSEIKKLLNENNLEYENDIEKSIIIRHRGKIIASGSYSENVIKSVVIDTDYQNQGLLNTLVTKLKKSINKNGYDKIFVYTTENSSSKFNNLGFNKIDGISPYPVLMEDAIEDINNFSKNLKYKFEKKINEKFSFKNYKNKNIAALVVNCNPITKGHLYLIEKAAKENDVVVIFVVSEDKSLFSTNIRYKLIKEATKKIKNRILFTGEDYIISHATFPTYFLGKDEQDKKNRLYAELDAKIFGEYFAQPLNINKRYVGKEPYSPMTAAYNKALEKHLPKYGIKVIKVDRKKHKGKAISASTVRKYIKDGKWDLIKPIVPKVTYEFLKNAEAKPIIKKIKDSNSRH